MAGHDHVDPVRGRIGPQVLEIVNDEDGPAGETDRIGFEIILGPAGCIDISSDRGDGGYLAKGFDNVGLSDIAAVDYVVHAGQASLSFRPQKSVGVGDDADSEGHRMDRME